jgi:hypothetical protein
MSGISVERNIADAMFLPLTCSLHSLRELVKRNAFFITNKVRIDLTVFTPGTRDYAWRD